MLEKDQNKRFDIFQVDREFKKTNLKTKNIHEACKNGVKKDVEYFLFELEQQSYLCT